MHWIETLVSDVYIRMLFDDPPEWKKVSIPRLHLDDRGPNAVLEIHTRFLPDHPPREWRDREYNATVFALSFWPIEDVNITGWGLDNVCDIDFRRRPESRLFELEALGGETSIRFAFGFAQIDRVSSLLTTADHY